MAGKWIFFATCLVLLTLARAATLGKKDAISSEGNSQPPENIVPDSAHEEVSDESALKKLEGIFDKSKFADVKVAFTKFGDSVERLGEQIKLGFDKFAKKYNLSEIQLPQMAEVKAAAQDMKEEASGAIGIAEGVVKDTEAVVHTVEINAEGTVKSAEYAKQKVKEIPVKENRAARYNLISKKNQPVADKGPAAQPGTAEESWKNIVAKVKAVKENIDPLKSKDALIKIQDAIALTREKLEKAMKKIQISLPKQNGLNDVKSRAKRDVEGSNRDFQKFMSSLKEAFGDKQLDMAFEDFQKSFDELSQTIKENSGRLHQGLMDLGEVVQGTTDNKHRRRRSVESPSEENEEADTLEKALKELKHTFDPKKIEARFEKLQQEMKEAEKDITDMISDIKDVFDEKEVNQINEKRQVEEESSDDEIAKIVKDFEEISNDKQAENIKKAFEHFAERIKKIGEHFKEGMKKYFKHTEGKDQEQSQGRMPQETEVPVKQTKREAKTVDNFDQDLAEVKNALNKVHLNTCFEEFEELLKTFKTKIESTLKKIEDDVKNRETRETKESPMEESALTKGLEEFKQEFKGEEIKATFLELFDELHSIKATLEAHFKQLEKDITSIKENEPTVKRYLADTQPEEAKVDEGLKRLKEAFSEDHIEKEFKKLGSAVKDSNKALDDGIRHFREWLKEQNQQYQIRMLREMHAHKEPDSTIIDEDLKEAKENLINLFKDIDPKEFEQPFINLGEKIKQVATKYEKIATEIKEEYKLGVETELEETSEPLPTNQETPAEVKSKDAAGKGKRETKEADSEYEQFPDNIIKIFDEIRKEMDTESMEKGIDDLQGYLKKFCSYLKGLLEEIKDSLKQDNGNSDITRRNNLNDKTLNDIFKELDDSFDEKSVKAEFGSLWKALGKVLEKMKNGTVVVDIVMKKNKERRVMDDSGHHEIAIAYRDDLEKAAMEILQCIKSALSPENTKKQFDSLKRLIEETQRKVEKDIKEIEQVIEQEQVPKRQLAEETASDEEGNDNSPQNGAAEDIEKSFEDLMEKLQKIEKVLSSSFDDIRKELGKEIKAEKRETVEAETKTQEASNLETLKELESLDIDSMKEEFDQLRKESVNLEKKFTEAADRLKTYFDQLKAKFDALTKEKVDKRSESGSQDSGEKIYQDLKEFFNAKKIKDAFTALYKAIAEVEHKVVNTIKDSKDETKQVLEKKEKLKSMFAKHSKRDTLQPNAPMEEVKETIVDLMKVLKKIRKQLDIKAITAKINSLHANIEDIEKDIDQRIEDFDQWISKMNSEERKLQQSVTSNKAPKSKRAAEKSVPDNKKSVPKVSLDDVMKVLNKEKLEKFNKSLHQVLSEGEKLSEALQKFIAKVKLPPPPELITLKPLEPLKPIEIKPLKTSEAEQGD